MAVIAEGFYLTKKGDNLIAKLLAAKMKLEFTRAELGSGTIPEDTTIDEIEGVAQLEMEGLIVGAENHNNGEATVEIQTFFPEQGYFLTEATLFATDPDEGEILYGYVVLAPGKEWIRPNAEAVLKLATLYLVAIVRNVPCVCAVINPKGLVTQKQLQAHNHAPFTRETHPAIYDYLTRLEQALEASSARTFDTDFVTASNIIVRAGVFNPALQRVEAAL